MSADIPVDQPRNRLSFAEMLERMETMADAQAQPLLEAIKARLPELEALREKVSSHWHAEDGFYRFYHQSWKVYSLQHDTEEIVTLLQSLMPDGPLNKWFTRIINDGTGKQFRDEHNQRWIEETRPILEAFFHARTMLELAVKYGCALESAPASMPSGWATLLHLYNLR